MKDFFTNKTHLTQIGVAIVVCVAALLFFQFMTVMSAVTYDRSEGVPEETAEKNEKAKPVLDTADYDRRINRLVHIPEVSATATTTELTATQKRWQEAGKTYPLPGALLPFNRIVAYYGNFYSTRMGVLGEYPEDQMLAMLKREVAVWEAADPTTPVIPAIHYIAATAQATPGKEGKYILRMPDSQIDIALALAKKVNGIVFVDLQVGQSDIQTEAPYLEKYLSMPEVHLAIDPEFYMRAGHVPGEYMGTMDAADVNWAAEYLAKIVRDNNLPPKILLLHRFTQNMLTNSESIKPLPEVQVVIDMDGWGDPAKKINTYERVITPEPVQFTGFKLFYKNDLKPPSTRLLTPKELLELTPSPVYIQYQ